jgi:hypothetical protein
VRVCLGLWGTGSEYGTRGTQTSLVAGFLFAH